MKGIRLRSRFSMLPILVMISCAFLFSLQAKAYRQGDATITLTANNITLAAVFKAIYQQTKMAVLYNNNMLNDREKVDVNFHDVKLEEALHFLLDKRGFIWIYNGTYISLSPKKKDGQELQHKSLRGDTGVTAQTISGKITDAAGGPLVGATVQVKGTGQGTTTDADGKFVLPEVENNDVLLISSVGYETRELKVKGRNIIAQLNVVVNDLDETVVVAYSTTTKRLSTGNVSIVKGDDIVKQPVGNPLLALQGRVAGLFITQVTGVPGGGVAVQIQGQNSLLNGNDPFYVIDGVPYSSQLLPNLGNTILGISGGNNAQAGNPLSFINPGDIESITILKDADATAIYGSRAANGAILITTKKGRPGQTKVDFNLQQGWGKVTRKLQLLNTEQYLQMRREAKKNDNVPVRSTDHDINGLWDTTRYSDWQKELIGGTAHYTNVSASVSGGTNYTQFLLGANYHRETTVFPGDFSDQKASVHFSVNNMSADQRFRLGLSGSYLIDNNRLLNSDLTNSAIKLAPNSPALYNEDGTLNWAPNSSGSPTWINPLSNLYITYQNKTTNLVSSAVLSYQLQPGLDIKSNFGYTSLQSNELNLIPITAVPPQSWPTYTRAANYGNNRINSWIIEPQLTYNRRIGKGRLEALIGSTFQQSSSNGQQLTGSGYNSDGVMKDIRSAATVVVGSSVISEYKYNALFGRIGYNFDNKYILNLTGRRDGSSRFGSANRFHNFGAVGLAWVFSKELAISRGIPFLSFGKLRGSLGTTGNDQIGDYRYMNQFVPSYAQLPYQDAAGLIPNDHTNPYLQWEETKKLQLGIDLGFLKDGVLLTVNYNHNRSSNQLLPYNLPIITGFSYVIRNFPATVQNTGWDFSLNVKHIKSSILEWSTSINVTLPKNKLVSFPDLASSSYANSYVVGQPITLRKAYRFAGVDPVNGTYQFWDSKGSLTTSPDPVADATAFINTAPVLYGGFENSIKFKGLQLDFLFQFVKQKGPNYNFGSRPGISKTNQPVSVLARWQDTGQVASIQRYSSNSSISSQYFAATTSDAFYTDASYIRLKNLSLSWDVPEVWRRQMHLKTARLYIQAQNLITITSYKGLDPETLSQISLPPLKVITVGVQMGL